MYAPSPEVLDFVGQRVDGLVATIVGAREKEMARKRIEACRDEIVAEEMIKRTPRWRGLARWHWRRTHRLAAARCVASGQQSVCVRLRLG